MAKSLKINVKEIKKIFLAAALAFFTFFYVLNEEELPFEFPQDNSDKQLNIVRVVKVIDGDTFDISTGERIRMIGIDTPERGEIFYKEAKVALEELIGDREIVLKKDVSETDRYQRLLRHVYIDDVWINQEMIAQGYARLLTVSPDVAHVDVFRKSEKEARKNNRGLWAESQ